jgi:hypothetical protein
MGYIAAAPPADLYFGQQLSGLFNNGYFQPRVQSRRINGTEKTRCPPADYDQVLHKNVLAKIADLYPEAIA